MVSSSGSTKLEHHVLYKPLTYPEPFKKSIKSQKILSLFFLFHYFSYQQEALQIQNTINAIKEDAAGASNSPAPPKDVQLPDDLTFHSKQVLLEIFHQFEVNIHEITGKIKIKFLESLNESYCLMETTVNRLSQSHKIAAKSFIEGLLSADMHCLDENTSQKQLNAMLKQPPATSTSDELQLPQDLSPFTKAVLNEIFLNYETNVVDFAEKIKKQIYELLIGAYGQFETSVNTMTENQRVELRRDMEDIFTGQDGALRPKERLSKEECGFDSKLARHFEELSRVVQVILDKQDKADGIVDEQKPVVDAEQPPNRIDERAPVVAGAKPLDDLEDTEYLGVPEFKTRKKRFTRLV